MGSAQHPPHPGHSKSIAGVPLGRWPSLLLASQPRSVLTGCPMEMLTDLRKTKHPPTLCCGLPIPSICLEHPPVPPSLQQPPVGTPELITHCLGEGVAGMFLLWMRTRLWGRSTEP